MPANAPDQAKSTTISANKLLPTARDRENERIRLEIAEKQEAEYLECLGWAIASFGPGWVPSHRHFLVDKVEEERVRHTDEKPRIAAAVFTVSNKDGVRRHFTITDGGNVIECDSIEAGFGEKLLEPHPTRRIEVRGQVVAPHRYSLCFAPFELYRPRSAEQLAALRATREKYKRERKERQWVADHPLWAWAGYCAEDFEDNTTRRPGHQ